MRRGACDAVAYHHCWLSPRGPMSLNNQPTNQPTANLLGACFHMDTCPAGYVGCHWAEPVMRGISCLFQVRGVHYTTAQKAGAKILLQHANSQRPLQQRAKSAQQDASVKLHPESSQQNQRIQELQPDSGVGREGVRKAGGAGASPRMQAQEASSPAGAQQRIGRPVQQAVVESVRSRVGLEEPPAIPMTRERPRALGPAASQAAESQAYTRARAQRPLSRDSELAPEPSTRPGAHYVAALAIKRSEDHRVMLSGCVPFADLRTLLSRSAGTGQSRGSVGNGGGGRSRRDPPEASNVLPPVVGEVVHTQIMPLSGSKSTLRCMLRDASLERNAVAVYVMG